MAIAVFLKYRYWRVNRRLDAVIKTTLTNTFQEIREHKKNFEVHTLGDLQGLPYFAANPAENATFDTFAKKFKETKELYEGLVNKTSGRNKPGSPAPKTSSIRSTLNSFFYRYIPLGKFSIKSFLKLIFTRKTYTDRKAISDRLSDANVNLSKLERLACDLNNQMPRFNTIMKNLSANCAVESLSVKKIMGELPNTTNLNQNLGLFIKASPANETREKIWTTVVPEQKAASNSPIDEVRIGKSHESENDQSKQVVNKFT